MISATLLNTLGVAAIGLVCAAVVGFRMLALFRKTPSAGCSGCSKCGDAQARTNP